LQHQVREGTDITSINGINSLEKIFLGGIEQWILIRGWDKTNPVLLFLHGGPGAPLFSYARKIGFDTGLEKHFVMVYWEQRGTGKSFSFSIPEESMTIEQFVSDIYELAAILRDRFNVTKILLVGRSWGSLVGILTVRQYPDLFHAFVGIGQLVHPLKSDSLSYEHTIHLAQRYTDTEGIAELRSISYPPYEYKEVSVQRKWLTRYYEKLMMDKFGRLRPDYRAYLLSTPEYTLWDVLMMGIDPFYSSRNLWNEEYYNHNLFEQIPEIDIPVFFLHGRYDYFTPGDLVKKYHQHLSAPKGKTLIWFENSGHEPEWTEPEKFREVIIKEVLKIFDY
jgi:pimeloyl-ACP methyl ester carboxylesterase